MRIETAQQNLKSNSARSFIVLLATCLAVVINVAPAQALSPTVGKFPNLTFTYGSSNTVPMPAPTSSGIGAWTFTSSVNSVATISQNTIVPVSLGTTTITATQASDGIYDAVAVSATLTIIRGTPVVGPFKDLIYQMPSTKIVTKTLIPPISNSNGAWTFTSQNTTVATIDGNVVSLLSLGIAPITAVQSATENFTQSAPVSMKLTVTGPSPQVDPWADMTFFFTDSQATIVPPKSTSTGAWSYVSSDPTIVSFEGNVATFRKIGKVTITANQAPSVIWGISSAEAILTVKRGVPIVGGFSLPNVRAGERPFAPIAPTSTSNGSWGYESSNTKVATIVDGLIKPIAAGTTTITAVQEGSSLFSESTRVTAVLTVTPGLVLPTVADIPDLGIFLGATASPFQNPASASDASWSYSSSDPLIVSVSDNRPIANAKGTVTITATQEPKGNFGAITKSFKVTVLPKFQLSTSLKGRVLTVKSGIPQVTVLINGVKGQVGPNKVQSGTRIVTITYQNMVVYNKKFVVK